MPRRIETGQFRQASLPVDLVRLPSVRHYNDDPRTSSSTVSSPTSRPVHPTPSRMVALDDLVRSHCVSHQMPARVSSRPTSTTAIPCPVSGTTRQATPTRLSAETSSDHESSTEPLLSPVYARRPLQPAGRLNLADVNTPPSAFRQNRRPVNREDTPDFLRIDLTKRPDTEVVFPPIKYSVVNRIPSTLAASNHHGTLSPNVLLPKSSTVNSLTSPKRNITPHRLMQPIYPPLPRSQTLTNISHSTDQVLLSPTKSPRHISFSRRFERVNTNQDSVLARFADNQSGVEHGGKSHQTAAHRLDNGTMQTSSQTSPRITGLAQSSNIMTVRHNHDHEQSAMINLSVNDMVNTARLEEQQRESPGRRQLFVNTTLSDSLEQEAKSPLLTSSFVESYSTMSTSDEKNPDPREVFTAEDITYWTGRFVAACDRLRQADCILLTQKDENTNSLFVNSSAFEERYNQLETTRTKRALQAIGAHCRTNVALESFLNFESHLSKAPKSTPTFKRSASDTFWKQDSTARIKHLSNRLNSDGIAVFKSPSGSCATSTSSLSAVNAQATFGRLSNLVERSGLVKSKTTGNLAIIPARATIRTSSNIRATPVDPSIGPKRSHFRKSSNLSISFNLSGESKTNAETRDVRQSLHTVRSMNHDLETDNRIDRSTGDAVLAYQNNRPQDGLASGTQNRAAVAAGSGTFSGYIGCDLTALPVRREGRKQHIAEITNGQRIPRIPTRITRSGSGEIIKKMVDASAREVRKMGRRVGSMGWGNSHEDLSVPERH